MGERLHPRQAGSGRNPRLACPHCGSRTAIRESRIHHRTYREVTYQCTNPHCSASFVAALEVLRVISPSGIPNPRLRLPERQRPAPPPPYENPVGDEGGPPDQTGPPQHDQTLPLPF